MITGIFYPDSKLVLNLRKIVELGPEQNRDVPRYYSSFVIQVEHLLTEAVCGTIFYLHIK
jgi:hypothetical protein